MPIHHQTTQTFLTDPILDIKKSIFITGGRENVSYFGDRSHVYGHMDVTEDDVGSVMRIPYFLDLKLL